MSTGTPTFEDKVAYLITKDWDLEALKAYRTKFREHVKQEFQKDFAQGAAEHKPGSRPVGLFKGREKAEYDKNQRDRQNSVKWAQGYITKIDNDEFDEYLYRTSGFGDNRNGNVTRLAMVYSVGSADGDSAPAVFDVLSKRFDRLHERGSNNLRGYFTKEFVASVEDIRKQCSNCDAEGLKEAEEYIKKHNVQLSSDVSTIHYKHPSVVAADKETREQAEHQEAVGKLGAFKERYLHNFTKNLFDMGREESLLLLDAYKRAKAKEAAGAGDLEVMDVLRDGFSEALFSMKERKKVQEI